jgi:hypothetical protein
LASSSLEFPGSSYSSIASPILYFGFYNEKGFFPAFDIRSEMPEALRWFVLIDARDLLLEGGTGRV